MPINGSFNFRVDTAAVKQMAGKAMESTKEAAGKFISSAFSHLKNAATSMMQSKLATCTGNETAHGLEAHGKNSQGGPEKLAGDLKNHVAEQMGDKKTTDSKPSWQNWKPKHEASGDHSALDLATPKKTPEAKSSAANLGVHSGDLALSSKQEKELQTKHDALQKKFDDLQKKMGSDQKKMDETAKIASGESGHSLSEVDKAKQDHQEQMTLMNLNQKQALEMQNAMAQMQRVLMAADGANKFANEGLQKGGAYIQ